MTTLNVPISTDNRPNPVSRLFVNQGCTDASITAFHRAIAYIATASSTPDIRAEIGDGASAWASGSHVCIGARPAFVPYPMRRNANASCSSCGCSDGAVARRTVQFSDPGTSPAVATKSKYANTVPANAKAMPTEQINRYFQDASTEAFVRVNGITMADVIVVASIATHMSATFWIVTAVSIVNTNAFVKIRKWRVCESSSRSGRPTRWPRIDASSATNAMHSVSSADSASTRHSAAADAASWSGPVATTVVHKPMLAANDSDAQITLTQPTNRLYGRTRIARQEATSGGVSRRERIMLTVRLSVPKPRQLFDIKRVERFVNVVDEDLHHQESHQRVEEHSKFDQQRHPVGTHDCKERNRVLEHEEADDLRDRLFSAHDDEQAHKQHTHGQRQPLPGRQIRDGHPGSSQHVREQHEHAGDHQRDFGVHVGRRFTLCSKPPLHRAEQRGYRQAL